MGARALRLAILPVLLYRPWGESSGCRAHSGTLGRQHALLRDSPALISIHFPPGESGGRGTGPLRVLLRASTRTCLSFPLQKELCGREIEDERVAPSSNPSYSGTPRPRITVVTWNVGTAMPPDDVTSLLHLGGGSDDSDRTDMIAIG